MSTRKPRAEGARRGRAARVAVRSAPPVISAAPPGQRGGRYRPLSEPEIKAIYETALRLLADLGMGQAPPSLVETATAKGARVTSQGRLIFPRGMVEDIIAGAAKSFVFHGRDPKHDFEIGGERVYFGTGGAAVQTLDIETGLYRPSTLQDLHDFTRLIDTLPNVSWFTRCCVATDVEEPFELDVNTAYALLRGTTKPVGTSFTVAESVDPIIDMFDLALGGEGRFRERPFCKAHISPVISPMRYGEDAVQVALACMRRGVPINCITAAQSGATAPATLAGFLAQSLAETLASLIMVNVFEPGYPVIFSNWPLVIDLRTGSFCGGGGEISVMNAASAQISNHLGLPSGVASLHVRCQGGGCPDGDGEGPGGTGGGLAGGNMIYESSGMMASLLGASFEAFVLDDEMLGAVHRAIRGVEVTEETLGFAAICEAVLGEGHFLGHSQTLAAMERDYHWPEMADRDPPVTWAEKGSRDAWSRAREKAKRILERHRPDYLGKDVDGHIRNRWPVR